jgi:hypothetical protein
MSRIQPELSTAVTEMEHEAIVLKEHEEYARTDWSLPSKRDVDAGFNQTRIQQREQSSEISTVPVPLPLPLNSSPVAPFVDANLLPKLPPPLSSSNNDKYRTLEEKQLEHENRKIDGLHLF